MRRLGAALVERIRSIRAEAKFVTIEAAPTDLALAIAEFWRTDDPDLPRLAIASETPHMFGDYALEDASAATLRNQNPSGVCVVVCEGFPLAERQSINGFIPIAPSELLSSKNNLMLLADAVAPVRRDGPVAAVREAIVLLPPGERPTAAQVAGYFDAIAAGEDPLAVLPLLGGFPDPGIAIADVRGDRIKENLALAARRRAGGDSPRAYAQIRTRAQRVIGRRPSGDEGVAAQFMSLLEAGSDDLLRLVSFDEAREILAAGPKGLAAAAKAELGDFRQRLRQERRSDANALPWDDYRLAATNLDKAAERQEAARELLSLDSAESATVFTPETRRKLQALLRDRVVRASQGSAPEAAIARAVRSLGQAPDRVVLADPIPAATGSQSSARDFLAVACARYRLQGLMRLLEAAGADVDGMLLLDSFDGVATGDVVGVFSDAGVDGASLPSVRLRLSAGRESVEVHWAPDADDYALLRCLVEFAGVPSLSLRIAGVPSAQQFAAADGLEAMHVPDALQDLVPPLQRLASDALRDGLHPERLRSWASTWTDLILTKKGGSTPRTAESAALAGCVEGVVAGSRAVGVTALAPLKAEWLADYLESSWSLVQQALAGAAENPAAAADFDVAVAALASITAAHIPAFSRLSTSDEPLLPSSESRIWSVFGGPAGDIGGEPHALRAVDSVLTRLISLQPEAAAHLKCLAVGPGAASLLLRQAISLSGRRIKGAEVGAIEIFAIGAHDIDPGVLAAADEHLASGDPAGRIQLRYVPDFQAAGDALGAGRPGAHFALLTGLTATGGQPTVNVAEIELPSADTEVLFSPRLWQRPETEQRILLTGPGPTETGRAWLRLCQRIDDRWPTDGRPVSVPEMRTAAGAAAADLTAVHELAMWVATLDRYATRDSLERAMGEEVAILHQEQRLGADSPIALVVSQKSGGPVDRAIGRSLRQARIVDDEGRATSIGADLRRVAAQGYGILALEAATSGTGINELVGHVVGFAMLGTASTPWPLPPGCRVVLVSLDEHPEWFLGNKRADLLALAIDVEESGLHGAVIEVKARRSDSDRAASEGLDQLKKTLFATAAAAYPKPGHLATRIWLNRIAEAVYAVARESRIRLTADELAAIEAFRRGTSTLEWAGVGLMFGPTGTEQRRVHRQAVDNDWVPIAIHDVRLTQERLEDAVATDLRNLYTAESDAAPLGGGRRRRRPEMGVERPDRTPEPEPASDQASESRTGDVSPETPSTDVEPPTDSTAGATRPVSFQPPIIGWDNYSGEAVLWQATDPAVLSNGHVQIWGSSGAGKTQFVKMLLAQLAAGNGAKFGIADFKNDYGPTDVEDFPGGVGAEFIDLWGRPGAGYNPLALDDLDDVGGVDGRIIEFRDSIEQAMASYQRIGARQKASIERALRSAYDEARAEHRWPTMLDLNREIGDDIAHILGDLTRYEIFADGPPLADVVDRNVVFGLNRIPGNGQTTVLAAAFLLAVIAQTMQDRPPVANTIRYAMVVDEAHRVAALKAIQLMLREGRSKGLAVVLATQAPADLPDIVDANAQTRVCFRLSDAVVASQAARKLDQGDDSLAERIRTLGSGEAFVSLGGSAPRLLTMTQHYRDGSRLELGDLNEAPSR